MSEQFKDAAKIQQATTRMLKALASVPEDELPATLTSLDQLVQDDGVMAALAELSKLPTKGAVEKALNMLRISLDLEVDSDAGERTRTVEEPDFAGGINLEGEDPAIS